MVLRRNPDLWSLSLLLAAFHVSSDALADSGTPSCEQRFLEDRIQELHFLGTLLSLDLEGKKALHFVITNLEQEILIGRDYLVQTEAGLSSRFGVRAYDESLSIDELLAACSYRTTCSEKAREFLNVAVRANELRRLREE